MPKSMFPETEVKDEQVLLGMKIIIVNCTLEGVIKSFEWRNHEL